MKRVDVHMSICLEEIYPDITTVAPTKVIETLYFRLQSSVGANLDNLLKEKHEERPNTGRS